MATTPCLLDDPDAVMLKMLRVVKTDEQTILGFIDRDWLLGRNFKQHTSENSLTAKQPFTQQQR